MMMTSSYEPVYVRAHAPSIHMQHHMPRTLLQGQARKMKVVYLV